MDHEWSETYIPFITETRTSIQFSHRHLQHWFLLISIYMFSTQVISHCNFWHPLISQRWRGCLNQVVCIFSWSMLQQKVPVYLHFVITKTLDAYIIFNGYKLNALIWCLNFRRNNPQVAAERLQSSAAGSCWWVPPHPWNRKEYIPSWFLGSSP